MTFAEALVMVMMAMITKEAPGIKRNDKRLVAYEQNIAHMVDIDEKVVGTRTDLFDDPRIARLFLGSVRFSESRFLIRPKDGDCRRYSVDHSNHARRFKKAGKKIPMWVYNSTRTSCPAKGPMQIAYGPHDLVAHWDEGAAMGFLKKGQKGYKPITVKQLRDPELNVRMGYAIHWHWKAEAEKKARRTAKLLKKDYVEPVPGAWFGAYRRGKLTSYFGQRFRMDGEARRRCRRMTHMMRELERLSTESKTKAAASKAKVKPASFDFSIPVDYRCGHEKRKKPKPKNIAKEKGGSGTKTEAASPRQ